MPRMVNKFVYMWSSAGNCGFYVEICWKLLEGVDFMWNFAGNCWESWILRGFCWKLLEIVVFMWNFAVNCWKMWILCGICWKMLGIFELLRNFCCKLLEDCGFLCGIFVGTYWKLWILCGNLQEVVGNCGFYVEILPEGARNLDLMEDFGGNCWRL